MNHLSQFLADVDVGLGEGTEGVCVRCGLSATHAHSAYRQGLMAEQYVLFLREEDRRRREKLLKTFDGFLQETQRLLGDIPLGEAMSRADLSTKNARYIWAYKGTPEMMIQRYNLDRVSSLEAG